MRDASVRPPQFCTTSWDDGHPQDLRVAELLAKYGLQGTFYIPIQSERARLTPAQIRYLSTGFEVGAHTVHHDDLTRLPARLAKREILEAKHRVEDLTGKPCAMFCFPFGKYRRQHLAFARDAGYTGVRTAELMSLSFPQRVDGIAVMPTTVQANPHTAWAYLRNACRRLAWRGLVNHVLLARGSTWEKTAQTLASLVARRGGVFHLWGHGWEIEEHSQWRQLEHVLRQLADCGAAARSLTNSALCGQTSLVSIVAGCEQVISRDASAT